MSEPSECDRCGTDTEHTLLDGTFRCPRCQEAKAREAVQQTRDEGQDALTDYRAEGGVQVPPEATLDELQALADAPREHREARAALANERQAELLAEIQETQERQADALEVIAGMLMVAFDYEERYPGYTVEALYEEALFHGKGGER